MVVFDKEGKNAYVIMDIDSYESLLDNQSGTKGDTDGASEYLPADNSSWALSNEPDMLDPIEISKDSESEVIRGIETEVVNIGETPRAADSEDDKNRYYFEEIEDESAEEPVKSSDVE